MSDLLLHLASRAGEVVSVVEGARAFEEPLFAEAARSLLECNLGG